METTEMKRWRIEFSDFDPMVRIIRVKGMVVGTVDRWDTVRLAEVALRKDEVLILAAALQSVGLSGKVPG